MKGISDQTKEVNTAIDDIEIRATDNSGQVVTNKVSGLPKGVTFDPRTSTISGVATKVGTYPIVVTSTDAETIVSRQNSVSGRRYDSTDGERDK